MKKQVEKDTIRVCAYGRVSTKMEEQQSSLETQKAMFEDWIKEK